MRALLAVLIVGSTLAALVALFGTRPKTDDELARSITQWVEKAR